MLCSVMAHLWCVFGHLDRLLAYRARIAGYIICVGVCLSDSAAVSLSVNIDYESLLENELLRVESKIKVRQSLICRVR